MTYEEFLKESERVQTLSIDAQKAAYARWMEQEQEKTATRVHICFQYAKLFYQNGDFRSAIEILEPLVLDYQSYDYTPKLISCFNLMGVATHCETEYNVSRYFYEIGLEIAIKNHLTSFIGYEYNNIALSYTASGRYAEALHSLEEGENYLPGEDNDLGAYLFVNKTNTYRKLHMLPLALEAYQIAVEQYSADKLLPDDTVLCAATLFYQLGDPEKYEYFKRQILGKLTDMYAAEFMDACQELFECGLDSGDEELVTKIICSMDQYMQSHPQEIRVGLAVADLKYIYAVKKQNKDAILEALELKNDFKDRIIHYSEQKRIKSLQQYREINAELQKAIRSKEAASNVKTRFLANMSHDIRTPLNGIIGLLKINAAHFDDRKLVRENQQKMEVAANHLLSLVNDVLQMSKIEDGTVKLSHESFELMNTLQEIRTIISEHAAEANITMLYGEHNHPVTYVYGSPLHLRQIFLNVYGNCIKYNKAGGSIRATMECLGSKDRIVTYRWTIQDTGVGMSEEFLRHIFEPFVQERTDARSQYQGTGLGMTIVKGLLDRMGGTIHVESEEGVGSTFIITIPFEIAPVPAAALKDAEVTEADICGLHLLLAEDNALNAEIAETLLTDRGAQVEVVKNGKQAVDRFQSQPEGTYDAILMDIMMPILDGLCATKIIRALPRPDATTIPIIAMTANAFAEDAQKCIEAGMNAHLAKPLDTQQMTAVIAKFSGKTRKAEKKTCNFQKK